MLKRAFGILLVIFLCGVSNAEGLQESFHWKEVQIGAIGTFQGSGFSGSGILRYNPNYSFSDKVSIGVSFDLSYQTLANSDDFMAYTYLLNFGYELSEEWGVQASAGMQDWKCKNCETKAALGIMAEYQYIPEWAALVQSLWVQYLNISQDPQAHQVLAGVGIKF